MKVKVVAIITLISILLIVSIVFGIMFKTELETTKAELETTKTELETTKAELETTKAELETTKAELETTKAELLLLKDNFNKEVKGLKKIEQEKNSYFLMKLLQHITPAKYDNDMIVIYEIAGSSQYLVDLIQQGLKKQGYNSSTTISDQRYRYGLSIYKHKLELKYHGRPVATINSPSN